MVQRGAGDFRQDPPGNITLPVSGPEEETKNLNQALIWLSGEVFRLACGRA